MSQWEQFFEINEAPSNFGESKTRLEVFCQVHREQKIVLITSGGTTIPLEHNTVRFVDNFSAGTRGSASAEYFLREGYNVVFLHRSKSLLPFVRHFEGKELLDALKIRDESDCSGSEMKSRIEVSEEATPKFLPILSRYKKAVEFAELLYIEFTTLSDYLWLLREACQQLACHGPRALLYLAAAVSDFYIPPNEIPEHKIQSAAGAPTIQLHLVPKMLAPLVSEWVPNAYVVSFKLETDPAILLVKARKALDTYKHKLVIGNILNTRKQKVTFVEPESHYDLWLNDEECKSGAEIEEKIVKDLFRRHKIYIDYFNAEPNHA